MSEGAAAEEEEEAVAVAAADEEAAAAFGELSSFVRHIKFLWFSGMNLFLIHVSITAARVVTVTCVLKRAHR